MKNKLLHTLLTSSERSLFRMLFKKFKNEDFISDFQNFFIVKGSQPITLVAHLDTVCRKVPTKLTYWVDKKSKNEFVVNADQDALGADDRAGVYTLLQVWDALPADKRPTLAFFNQEEKGCIGVRAFLETSAVDELKDEHMFIEFDRHGVDNAVFYSTTNEDFQNLILETYKVKKEYGSTSDITKLTAHYKISSANVSIGYTGEHRAGETLNISCLDYRVRQTISFLSNYTGTTQYKETPPTYGTKSTYRYTPSTSSKKASPKTLLIMAHYSRELHAGAMTSITKDACPDCKHAFVLNEEHEAWECNCTYFENTVKGELELLDHLYQDTNRNNEGEKWYIKLTENAIYDKKGVFKTVNVCPECGEHLVLSFDEVTPRWECSCKASSFYNTGYSWNYNYIKLIKPSEFKKSKKEKKTDKKILTCPICGEHAFYKNKTNKAGGGFWYHCSSCKVNLPFKSEEDIYKQCEKALDEEQCPECGLFAVSDYYTGGKGCSECGTYFPPKENEEDKDPGTTSSHTCLECGDKLTHCTNHGLVCLGKTCDQYYASEEEYITARNALLV